MPYLAAITAGQPATDLRIYSRSRELERYKAKTSEEAECTFVHEHSELVFNAVAPTRSRS